MKVLKKIWHKIYHHYLHTGLKEKKFNKVKDKMEALIYDKAISHVKLV